jgi:hypothetical protein
MAQVQYGSIITEIKGKVSGSTFQSGRGFKSMKNTGRQVKGVSPQKQRVKSAIQAVSHQWGALTQQQRDDWAAFVGDWPFVNRFGESYTASPYQLFCAACLRRRLYFDDYDFTAPSSVPVMSDTGNWIVDIFTIDNIDIGNDAAYSPGWYGIIYASPVVSPGRGYSQTGLRFLGVVPSGEFAVQLPPLYEAVFPPLYEGGRVFIRMAWVHPTFPRFINVFETSVLLIPTIT